MKTPKEATIEYCRISECPVQKTIDRHMENEGSIEELKMIKDSNCTRCDVYKVRKYFESKGYNIESKEGE
jgi:hypothetical protein